MMTGDAPPADGPVCPLCGRPIPRMCPKACTTWSRNCVVARVARSCCCTISATAKFTQPCPKVTLRAISTRSRRCARIQGLRNSLPGRLRARPNSHQKCQARDGGRVGKTVLKHICHGASRSRSQGAFRAVHWGHKPGDRIYATNRTFVHAASACGHYCQSRQSGNAGASAARCLDALAGPAVAPAPSWRACKRPGAGVWRSCAGWRIAGQLCPRSSGGGMRRSGPRGRFGAHMAPFTQTPGRSGDRRHRRDCRHRVCFRALTGCGVAMPGPVCVIEHEQFTKPQLQPFGGGTILCASKATH